MFVVFEGIDGAGKSSLIEKVKEHYLQQGVDVLALREPGSTQIGEEIRKLILHETMSPKTEVMLFFAARAELVETKIKPALNKGTLVLLDRYSLSTYAYQGAGRGLDVPRLIEINDFVTNRLDPDVAFVVDVPVDVALKRSKKTDKFDNETVEFFERVRETFVMCAKFYNGFVLLDGTKPLEDLVKETVQIIEMLWNSLSVGGKKNPRFACPP